MAAEGGGVLAEAGFRAFASASSASGFRLSPDLLALSRQTKIAV